MVSSEKYAYSNDYSTAFFYTIIRKIYMLHRFFCIFEKMYPYIKAKGNRLLLAMPRMRLVL
jgi:hypothetical protein